MKEWLTLFSNILILPIASLGLIVSLVAVLLSFVSPAVAAIPAFLGDLCASVTVRAAEMIVFMRGTIPLFPRNVKTFGRFYVERKNFARFLRRT